MLGIETQAELEKSPFLGALFEGFLASEIVKAQVHSGGRRELYYFRDQQGLEVDFVVPGPNASVTLVEAKASRTVTPDMAVPMQRLAAAWAKHPGRRGTVQCVVVHRPQRSVPRSYALAPNVAAIPWPEWVAAGLKVPGHGIHRGAMN